MAEVTQEWAPEEREAFCTLLTRFNPRSPPAWPPQPSADGTGALLKRPRGAPHRLPAS